MEMKLFHSRFEFSPVLGRGMAALRLRRCHAFLARVVPVSWPCSLWDLSIPLIALISLSLAVPVLSQTSSGSIAGGVRDSQDLAVSNATVTITELQRKTSLVAKTDAEGRFVFPQLLPGMYNISVEAPGFKKVERKDIALVANDKITVGTITLEVGSTTETVEVSAQVLELKTESSERSDAIVGKQLTDLAVNSRSYLQLAGLATGVVSTANLTTGGHGGLANISANGQRFDHNQLTLNGIGNVDTGNNGDQLATISLDAVQEYKILTSSYQAEYGRSAGAQISVVTKSGTSSFHGSGYLYHRHEGLNANNWKNNRDGLPRQLFRFNDPGYTIGGPIYIPNHFNRNRNKLFFFWSQEFQEQLKPQGRRDATFPTLLERQGDFSKSADKNGNPFPYIRDPLDGRACNAGNTAGCFQDGGVLGRIPANRLYSPGIAVLNFFPQPNALGNIGFNYRSQLPDSYPRRESLIRIDHNLSSKWKLFGHYLDNKDSVTSAYGSFVLGSGFPKVPITDTRPGKSYVVSATTLISPTMTNEATFGYGHNQINIDPANNGLTRATTGINIPVIYPGAVQQDFIPRFSYAGTRIGNEQRFGTNNAPFFNYNTTLDWIDNVSKVWKQHVFKAGIYIQRSRKDQTSFGNSSGEINFGDNSSNPLDTGFGFANMAIGVYTSYNQASAYLTGKYRYTNVEWYLQDQWKITRRLTLDYGLRFYWIQPQFDADLQTATFLPSRFDFAQAVRLYQPIMSNGRRLGFDPVTGQTVPGSNIGKIVPNSGNTINGVARAGKDISKYLIRNRGIHYSPRLGFAYDITGKQSLVLRAGSAILYDRFQGNEVFDMITNPPATISPTLVNGFLSDIVPGNVLLAPPGLNAFDYNGKVPTTYAYHFGIQTKLPFGFIFDTAYVGSMNRHELERRNINAIPYGATFLRQNQDCTKFSGGTCPASPPFAWGYSGSQAYDANFLRPYPGFSDIAVHEFGGTSNYNSLQTSVNRRFARGLFFGFNWTWSRALGTSGDRGNFNRIDNLTRFANYGPLSFDRLHTVNIFYTYDLPGIFRAGWAHTLVDGWQISGATLFQSGTPYQVGLSISGIGNTNLTGSYTEPARVHLVGNPLSGISGDAYHRLNPSAFAPPNVPSIGIDSPTNYLRGPGINNTNLSVQKTFQIRESTRLQLRADAFNVFNHTQFSGINSTANFAQLTNPTIQNLPSVNPDGSLKNKDGFGTVSGARDPRIMQLVVRFVF
jgi:hypothetical protein